MNQNHIVTARRYMKMSELRDKSGFTKSLIQHYINIELLHKPLKTGKTIALYDENHLIKLRRIRRLKKKKGMSLAEIKSIFDHESGGEGSEDDQIILSKKTEILEKAVEILSSNGFINTTLSDIAEAAGLKKYSLYFYYDNKKELFIDCVSHLISKVSSQDNLWKSFNTKSDYIARLWLKIANYLNLFRYFSGIFTSLRAFLESDDLEMAQFARDAFKTFLKPVISDHRRAINKGILHETDEVLISYGIFGFAEAMGYALMLNPLYALENVVDFSVGIFNNGMFASNSQSRNNKQSHSVFFDVTDLKSKTTRIWNVTFGNEKYLHGKIGKERHSVELEDISSLGVHQNHPRPLCLITTESGEKLSLRIDEDLSLAGKSLYGDFLLSFKDLSHMTNIHL